MSIERVKIGEIAEVKGGKRLPKGFFVQDDPTDHPYLRVVDFDDNGLNPANVKFITNEVYEKIRRYTIADKDIYVSIAGTIGRVGMVPTLFSGANLTENAAKITNISNNVHVPYLCYFLKGYTGQTILKSKAGGTSQPKLALYRIAEVEFPNPPLAGQRRIAQILSVYDDLIENNRCRIALLERAAREIYREWFVRLRFPGHEDTKIVDGVPEGWEKKPLGDVLTALESGGRPRGGARKEGIPSIGAENVIGIGQYDYSREKYVPEEYFHAMRKGIVRNRDVLVYKDGANIGRPSYFGDGFPHEHCAVNEHVFILRGLPEVGQNLLYFWIAQHETRQRIANLNANTAQPGVSQRKLKTLGFLQPQQTVASLFNNKVESVVQQIFLLARANYQLTGARDLLLPRLMSGEVAV